MSDAPVFAEFPKMLQHPAWKKGEAKPIGDGPRPDYQGEPDRFPPVLVHSPDDLEYYEAKGYFCLGSSDEEAFNAAAASAPADPNFEPAEYPKWVGDVIVNSAEEEAALTKPKATKKAA